MTTNVLPDAYRGDVYSFSMTFPSAAYLSGSPANVLAQIRTDPDATTIAATWTPTVLGAVLTLTIAAVTLSPGTYCTDVQVGTVTYLRNTPFRVIADVSRTP